MRLIDADALDAEMYHKSFEVDDGRSVWNSGLWIRYKIFEEAIRDAPTIDAVPAKLCQLPSAQPEIIRCKDCKYYRWEIDMCDEPYSTAHNVVHEDDYCSRAERRTDEE